MKRRLIPFVGIDDFAFKKHFSYGTLFIDLETRQPIDMIPSTDSTAVTQWLSTQPEISLITRDGSRGYAKAVRDASPTILQVADRWHVLQQLFDASKKAIYDCIPHKWTPSNLDSEPIGSSDSSIEAILQDTADQRWERIQRSQTLYEEGYKIAAIARILGVARGTVYADLRVTRPPARQRETPHKRFKPLIESLVRMKMSTRQIEKECRANGYSGSVSTLNGMIARARNRYKHTMQPVFHFRQKILCSIWNRSNKNTLEEIAGLHPQLLQTFHSLIQLNEWVHSFCQLMGEKAEYQLFSWLEIYQEAENPFIKSFIQGIRQDFDAILLGIWMHWSNGPVEGTINRLKMIKRMMYGRAGLDVLRNRLLYRF